MNCNYSQCNKEDIARMVAATESCVSTCREMFLSMHEFVDSESDVKGLFLPYLSFSVPLSLTPLPPPPPSSFALALVSLASNPAGLQPGHRPAALCLPPAALARIPLVSGQLPFHTITSTHPTLRSLQLDANVTESPVVQRARAITQEWLTSSEKLSSDVTNEDYLRLQLRKEFGDAVDVASKQAMPHSLCSLQISVIFAEYATHRAAASASKSKYAL